MGVNKGRVWLGGLAGGVVWTAWSFFIGTRLAPHYMALLYGNVDWDAVCVVDLAGPSVHLGAARLGAGTHDGAEGRSHRWFLRGISRQFWAGHLVHRSASSADGVDARSLGRRNSGSACGGVGLQGVSQKLECGFHPSWQRDVAKPGAPGSA